MYAAFKYESLPLKDIVLDERNPRLVTQAKLSSQKEILAYLYEHEGLDEFVRKIAHEGRNPGAERPYVIQSGPHYVVIEGNTRIAAYKVLTGLMVPPKGYSVPHVSAATLATLATVDCTVAPNRDVLMPIMASAHFGHGDKSKWNYLGSRKYIYEEWKSGHSLAKLAKTFGITYGEVKDYILEYLLYQKALGLNWTKQEKERLLNPAVAFNPPVRFLQTSGHKEKMGISYDSTNLKIVFSKDAEKKFKHLLKKLVITPVKGFGATATYDAVFADYESIGKAGAATSSAASSSQGAKGGSHGVKGNSTQTTATQGPNAANTAASNTASSGSTKGPTQKKLNALFAYPPTMTNALVAQLMKEAKDIDVKKFPASATFLLRNIVESVLKHIIDDQKANKAGNSLDLEASLNLCGSNHVSMPVNDKKILKQFRQDHLSYLNLGAHGNVIPNPDRIAAARDCIDQFIKKYV